MEHWPAYEEKMRVCQHPREPPPIEGEPSYTPPWSYNPPASPAPRSHSPATRSEENAGLLTETVMLKLNGGLGTGMGLEKAKSLLEIKDGNTFLDFIAKQVEYMRSSMGVDLAFMLMNSFATSKDTLDHLSKYDGLSKGGIPLEFCQNKAPKVTASDMSPAIWPAAPSCEWCPPGHGDLYPAIVGSGTLDILLSKGYAICGRTCGSAELAALMWVHR
eukprot:scaffold91134_cov32-Tisochrysis_lutea.AAC.2